MNAGRVTIVTIADPDLLAATQTMAKLKRVVEERVMAYGSSVVTMKGGRIFRVTGSQLQRRRWMRRFDALSNRRRRKKH